MNNSHNYGNFFVLYVVCHKIGNKGVLDKYLFDEYLRLTYLLSLLFNRQNERCQKTEYLSTGPFLNACDGRGWVRTNLEVSPIWVAGTEPFQPSPSASQGLH